MHCRPASNQVESIRACIAASVETMVTHLLARMQETDLTLEGLERAVLDELHKVGNVTLAALAGGIAPPYAPATSLCPCGGEAVYQRVRNGQCKTLLGTIQVRRAYYLCATCHHGHCPLDKRLGFCAGGISAGLEALLALLGSEFSFGHAAEMIAKLNLVHVSASRCRQATNALGTALAVHEESVRHAVWEQGDEPPAPGGAPGSTPGQQPLDPLYVSADGVIVPTRETGWREQCVGAVYTAAPGAQRRPPLPNAASLRSRGHSYVSELGNRPAFVQTLWLEAHRRGLEQAQQVVFIGDGAAWLWQSAEEHFPTALQVLDWYHAASYVRRAAQALYSTDEALRTQWAESQLNALWQSRTIEVMAALGPLAAGCKAAEEALGYFTTHHARMDYAHYRSMGLQVGSGAIESACKHVIQARIKQAGMRWSVHNARTLGKLRARLKSGRWEETLALRTPRHRSYRRQLNT